MKILMINKFLYPRGGSESYMLSLGDAFAAMGHEVSYFGMFDENNTVGNDEGQYTGNMDFHGKGLARFLYPFKIIYSFEAKRKLGKVLDSFRPDIVHMNNINFQLTPSMVYAVKKRNIPLVQTVHDYQMVCPNHLFYNFEKNEPCEKCLSGKKWHCYKNKCIHGSRIKSLLGVIEAKFYGLLGTYKKVDLYICPSHFLEKKLTDAKDFYKGKTFTIHNFIKKTTYEKAKTEEKPYIIYVGRFSKEKGVENLAAAARLLPEYRFVVCGSGPDENLLDGAPNIEKAGFLTGDALTEKMANAKALILPSVCYENCPLSILEAHALGVPVITMQSGGMAELVRNGETGTLVPSPSPSCIAEKIRETVENEAYYQSLLENCRKEKENILDVTAYAEKIMEKYTELIGRE